MTGIKGFLRSSWGQRERGHGACLRNPSLAHVPGAREKTAIERFHVALCLGEAVDKVRLKEHKAMMKERVEDLKGTKYDWLTHSDNLPRKRQITFNELRSGTYTMACPRHLIHAASLV